MALPKKRTPAGGQGLRHYELLSGRKYSRPDVNASTFQSDPVGLLLPRLDDVKQHGKGWTATCPNGHAHKGGLSIAAGDDNRLLLHCFKGCSAVDVVASVGLTLGDLFPERLAPQTPEQRRALRQSAMQASWAAALSVLALESTIVVVGAETILRGGALTAEDVDRLQTADNRIHDAHEVLRHA